MHVMVDPVRLAPLNMPVILPFVLLILFHKHIQLAWAQNISIALPLVVRSPYLSCWLPINGTVNANSDPPSATASDLSQACPFFESNPAEYHDLFIYSRREICVSLSVSMAPSTASLGQLPTNLQI